MNDTRKPEILTREGKPDLAYLFMEGDGPLVVFLGGFKSDMRGTKAFYLEEFCKERGRTFLRFDYSGHGESSGAFKDGTIGSWAANARDVISHVNVDGKPVILVGSSMGGWISLLLGVSGGLDIKGLIGIAAAPDFTKKLHGEFLNEKQRAAMAQQGYVEVPNEYSAEPYIFTKALIEDGEERSLLGQSHEIDFPIHLLQGKLDPDVPWETALKIREAFGGEENVQITFIEDGDHRLSRDEDLALLGKTIEAFF